jgi:hypothetical protein
MEKPQLDYLYYLLRLWCVDDDKVSRAGAGATAWRASLQDGLSANRINFANLEELFTFLRQQTEAASDSVRDGAGSKP